MLGERAGMSELTSTVVSFALLFCGTAVAWADDAVPTAAAPADSQKVERLLAAMKDDSFKVRLQAAVLLGRVSDTRAADVLIEAVGSDPHYTVRAAAANALANLGEPRAIPHILRRIAIDNEPFVREEAMRALGKYARSDALPYVVAAFRSPDVRVRKQALDYVAAEPNTQVEPVLMQALGDESREVFGIAAAAVRRLPKAEQLALLKRAIDHREPSVRRGAIEVLQQQASDEGTQLILEVYGRDIEEEEVRNAARAALRQLKQHLPLDDIVHQAQQNPEKHERARALRLLGVVGGVRAKEVLLTALSDDDPYVRGNAVMALGELGDTDVVPSLERLIEDPANQRIVHLVRHTLRQLRGRRGKE